MPVQINPKLESTKKRLTILRNHIYDMSKIFEKSGSKSPASDAIREVSKKTGFSVSYLRDVYYKY